MFCDAIFLSREYTLKEIHAYVAVILNCSRGEISGATLLADYRTFPHPPYPRDKCLQSTTITVLTDTGKPSQVLQAKPTVHCLNGTATQFSSTAVELQFL
jgi:hypothetical protein